MNAHLRTAILLGLTLAGCARLQSCSGSHAGWEIAKIEERWNTPEMLEDLVTFRNGKTWDNVGMKAEYIGAVHGPDTTLLLLFRALNCVECEADVLLTARSTASEKIVSESFPGKLTAYDMETGESAAVPYAEIRAYYGRCLANNSSEVLIIDSILDSLAGSGKKAYRKVIGVAADGFTSEQLDSTPEKVRAFHPPAGCQEIAGIDRDVG